MSRPAFAWTGIRPDDAGFVPDLAARLDAMRAEGHLPNLHGVVAERGGRIFLERYFAGRDQDWGRDLGAVAFGPETLHDLRSVTKSIVGLLYGIALAEGRVPPPEAPLLAQFPDCADLAADPARTRWTIAHTLTMTLGTEWDETLPYSDPRNSEIAMECAPDRYRFILDRPIVAEPGTRWSYNGGATALLGALIARGTGRALPDYARAALFDPLGIGPTGWARGPDGVPSAASGLRMAPRDLARIGRMMLGGGRWDGRQAVPEAWIDAARRPQAALPDGRGYGYQWYRGLFGQGEVAHPEPWTGAIGNGGQRLYLLSRLDVTVTITAGNYNLPDQWIPPILLLREVILAGLREG
ncbi:MAG TPA: serine hydrolase [Roseomonas sp.]|jgi:CubicO group peptidase (beta-lactamase class C family)